MATTTISTETNGNADIIKELESTVDVFDERAIPIKRRIALTKSQIAEWNEGAYIAHVAFQTNRAIGVPVTELKPLVDRFTVARSAVKDLEARLAELQAEDAAANGSGG